MMQENFYSSDEKKCSKSMVLEMVEIELRKPNHDRTTHIWEVSRMDAQR